MRFLITICYRFNSAVVNLVFLEGVPIEESFVLTVSGIEHLELSFELVGVDRFAEQGGVVLHRADDHLGLEGDAHQVEDVAVVRLLVRHGVEGGGERAVVLEGVEAHGQLAVGDDLVEGFADLAHEEAFVALVFEDAERERAEDGVFGLVRNYTFEPVVCQHAVGLVHAAVVVVAARQLVAQRRDRRPVLVRPQRRKHSIHIPAPRY